MIALAAPANDVDAAEPPTAPDGALDDGYALLDGRSHVCLDDLVADDSGASP